MKNIRVFYLNIFQFLEVKFSIYLNRRVFVMQSGCFLRKHLSFLSLKNSPIFRKKQHIFRSEFPSLEMYSFSFFHPNFLLLKSGDSEILLSDI